MTVLASRDHQLAEVFGGLVTAREPNREFPIRGLEAARREFQVFPAQSRLNVGDREVPGRECQPVHPDPHRRTGPAYAGIGNAGDRREAIGDVALGVVGQFHPVQHRTPHVDVHGRACIGVLFADLRRAHVLRQIAHGPRDPVADIVRGGVDIAVEVELQVDARAAVGTRRTQCLYALDAADLILDHRGDPAFNDVGRRAGIGGADGNDRRRHVRIFPQRQEVERKDAEGHQGQADDGGKYRSLDGRVGQPHGSSLIRRSPAERRRDSPRPVRHGAPGLRPEPS